MLEDDNILCDVCKMKQQHSESILELKFEIFESKEDMKQSIDLILQNNPKDIYSKNQQYSSNIVHELVYLLVNNKYKFKRYRMNYIWGLEIISEKQEFPDLLKDLNCNLETPEDVLIRKNNIKNQKIVNYIHNLIKISENRTITTKQNNFKSFQMTNEYHSLQTKIFDYLKENYDQDIRKCKNCKEIIYIFGDLEKIGKLMKLDKAKDKIINDVKNIINLRVECNNILKEEIKEYDRKTYKNLEIKGIELRHKFIINYFQKFLEVLES